jgi:hypothetical protein
MKFIPFIVILSLILAACGNGDILQEMESESPTHLPVSTSVPTVIVQVGTTPALMPSSTPTLTVSDWKSLPIIPNVSTAMVDVFQRGLSRGRLPDRFSKIGDCQNIVPYFLSAFSDPTKYRLGDQYSYLQSTIDHFSGSWSRKSIATHAGFNAATVLSPFWTLIPRPAECEQGEPPVSCELRIYNPSFTLISMEEAWSGDIVKYDSYMRMLIEYVLSQDVVPIIATRAELSDAPVSINDTVVKIADDYDIPLWNFGAAAESLPGHGLSEDGFHLTPGTVEGNYYFDDPARMQLGWTWRNLTALLAIDSVYRLLNGQP